MENCGQEVLKQSVRDMSTGPGVYRMLDKEGKTLYVGKAKNLKKRVSSYFSRKLNTKNISLINNAASIDVTVTANEPEALLLESNLIKTHKPRYNILLRDDKSYPYIRIGDEEFARLTFARRSQGGRQGGHKGRGRKGSGRYYGPYTSSGLVRETMDLIFKTFQLRQCAPSVFEHRSRPCLQYQIKRCCAPCVGYVTPDDYAERVAMTDAVLTGKCDLVVEQLVERMKRASEEQDYETATVYRDRISKLRNLLQKQSVISAQKNDADIIVCCLEGRSACVQVVRMRDGLNIGNRAFFPTLPPGLFAKSADDSGGDVADNAFILEKFIGQYYLAQTIPDEVIVNAKLHDREVVEVMLGTTAGRKITVSDSVRSRKRKWVELAEQNALDALKRKLSSQKSMYEQYVALRDLLGLSEVPRRMECFDISHTMGQATVASCVVFNHDGADKSNYRRFNITDITGGDDYAAMAQALVRRFRRVAKESKEEQIFPDVLFIDGGKGQVSAAREALQEFKCDNVKLVGIAKGPKRRAGEETLVLEEADKMIEVRPNNTAENVLALRLIQQIRDEAHRFAIMGHRRRRAKKSAASMLEDVPGLGPKRRRSLLQSFGGLQGVGRASVDELASVKGISHSLARSVYEILREHGEHA